MYEKIRITTGARLHFGFLAYPQGMGRAYGGLGVMIERPGYQLTVRRALQNDATSVSVSNDCASSTVLDRIKYWYERYQISARSPIENFEIVVENIIPPHRGLGSGTQGALAVAQAISFLTGERSASVMSLAKRVGRGARSAVGIHGFHRGGLLIDGGKNESNEIGKLLIREEFPHEWRFVLVAPSTTEGYSGHAELQAFAQLPPMPESLTERLSRLVLLELLPAVQERDVDRFSAAIGDYGDIVGGHFAPLQGGIFASSRMAELAAELRRDGIAGIAQSSWGPTIAILCANSQSAEDLSNRIRGNTLYSDCDILITQGMNSGAILEFEE
ncbi:MAG: beta-RFAP synthase [Planctomycetota bacterium]|nr:beta-RFAP synthase [Planctomycetota bacterium]MDA1214726.1 beta-RFAP synthase [Planctomycetota bacterium]